MADMLSEQQKATNTQSIYVSLCEIFSTLSGANGFLLSASAGLYINLY
jgi:hypothetical protein